MTISKSLCLAALVLLVQLVPAVAQVRLPGQVERPAPAGIEPVPPRLQDLVIPSFSIELPAGTRPPTALDTEMLKVEELVVTGNEAIATADLQALWQPLLGNEVTAAALYAVADAVTRRYAEAGYFLSFAYFPEQSVEDGRFRLTVVEGWIERVQVLGVQGGLAATIERRFAAALAERPVRLRSVERAILLVNDLAGVAATATLQPVAGVPGANALVVTARHDPWDFWTSIDNRGSKYAGPLRAYAEMSAYSAMGMGELVRLRGLNTLQVEEQRFVGVDTRMPLGEDGLRFDFSAAFGDTSSGYTLKPFEIRGRSVLLDGVLGYPVLRSLESTFVLTAGFHWIDSRMRDRFHEVYNDHIRELSVGFQVDHAGLLGGTTRFSTQVRKGINLFHANDTLDQTASRPDSNPDAMRIIAELRHVQPILGPVSLVLHGEGQYAPDRLLAAQEYAVGGSRFGRGYDLGEITGDHGLAGSAELRYSFAPMLDGHARPVLYAFYDGGMVWERKPAQTGFDARQSTGLGMRVDTSFAASGFLEYAIPLVHAPSTQNGSKDGRLFFGLALRF